MATLTIRNLPDATVARLKELAQANDTSTEQFVREILEEFAVDRETLLKEIEASWAKQNRRPSAAEIDAAIEFGRRY